ncbi:MAG: hypothetical protein ACPGID_06410 [Rubricella sp.]
MIESPLPDSRAWRILRIVTLALLILSALPALIARAELALPGLQLFDGSGDGFRTLLISGEIARLVGTCLLGGLLIGAATRAIAGVVTFGVSIALGVVFLSLMVGQNPRIEVQFGTVILALWAAIAATAFFQGRSRDALILVIGAAPALGVMVVYLATPNAFSGGAPDGARVSTVYAFNGAIQGGFLIFGGLVLALRDTRLDPRRFFTLVAVAAAGLALYAQAQWDLGMAGMPLGLPVHTEAYARGNLVASIAALVCAVALALIPLARTAR